MDDHSGKNTIDDAKHKINTKHNTKLNNVCSDLKNTWGTREHARSVAVFVVRICFCCCHTHPLHIAHWLKMFAFSSHSIPWSSPCRVHELSVLSDFLDLFINFTFLLFFISIFQHFLLPFVFSVSPRRWGLMTITSPSQVMSPQRLTSSSIRSP